MVNKYSIASKKRWAQVPIEERSKKGKEMAIAKWSKISKEDKKRHIERMNNARKGG